MSTLNGYTSYNFVDKDPIIDEVRTVIEDAQVSTAYVANKSGVAVSTLNNWFLGRTKRPQFSTVNAVFRSLGYTLKPVRDTVVK